MNLLRSILANNTSDSSKRWLAFFIVMTMCLSVGGVTFAIVYQALKHWSVDGALVTAYITSTGIVSTLGTLIYRKAENVGVEAPPAPGADSALGPRPGSGGAQ